VGVKTVIKGVFFIFYILFLKIELYDKKNRSIIKLINIPSAMDKDKKMIPEENGIAEYAELELSLQFLIMLLYVWNSIFIKTVIKNINGIRPYMDKKPM
jgi:hypothetical protein